MTIPFKPDMTATQAPVPVDQPTPQAPPEVPSRLKGVADSVEMLIGRGATTTQIDKFLADRGMTPGQFQIAWRLATQQPVDTQDPSFAQNLDRMTGAPLKARNAVAGLPHPDAQLQWLHENGYPDAIPYKDTYVYTDQKTGRPTLFSQEGPGLHGIMAILGSLPGMGQPGNAPSPDAVTALNALVGKGVDNASNIGGVAGQVYVGAKGAAKGAALGSLVGLPVAGAAAGALAGGGAGFAGGKEATQMLQRTIGGVSDPRSLGGTVGDIADEFKLGAESEAVGRATVPAMKAVLGAAPAVGNWMTTISPELQNAVRPQAKVLLEYATQLGIPAGLAQTSKSLVLNSVTGLLRRMPIASNVLNAADEAGNAGMSRAVQRVADQIAHTDGPAVNPDGTVPRFTGILNTGGAGVEAGSAATQEAALNVVTRYRAARDALQQTFQQTMGGPQSTIPALPNAQVLADGLRAEMARAPSVNTPLLQPALAEVQKVLDAAAPPTSAAGLVTASGAPMQTGVGGIPLDILQRARTAIGEVAFDESPLVRADPTVKYLRDVYGSLTKDLTNAAQTSDRAAGFIPKNATDMGPAETALHLHDTFVSNFMDDGALGNFNTFKKLAESPAGTDPLPWVIANSKTNPAAVTRVLDQFTPPERNAVVGSIFQQMGRAASGLQNDVGNVWDPSVFRANWDKIRLVRDQLFDGTRYQNTVGDIDKIFQLAQRMPKPKGAGNPLSGLIAPFMEFEGARSMGAGVIGTAATVGGMTVGSGVMARLLSDPTFSRWALSAASAAKNGTMDYAPLLTRLLFIQRQKPRLASDVGEYVDALKGNGMVMPGLGTFDRLSTPGVSYAPRP